MASRLIFVSLTLICFIVTSSSFGEELETRNWKWRKCIKHGKCSINSQCCSNLCKENRRCGQRISGATPNSDFDVEGCTEVGMECRDGDTCCTGRCSFEDTCLAFYVGEQVPRCPREPGEDCEKVIGQYTTTNASLCVHVLCDSYFCDMNTKKCACPVDIPSNNRPPCTTKA